MDKNYNIVIFTGNLDDEFLVAEVYQDRIFMLSLQDSESGIVVDLNCYNNCEDCLRKKEISLFDLIHVINESLDELDLGLKISLDKISNDENG